MASALRFRGHLWYLLEVAILVYCLYDFGACQYRLGVGDARGLSTFWSGAGRIATLIVLVYFFVLVYTWYRRRVLDNKLGRVRLFLSTQVITWLLVLYDATDFHLIRVHFAISLGVGIYALLQMVRTWAQSRFSAGSVRRAELVLFCICGSLLGLEIGMRTVAMFSDAPILAHSNDSVEETMRRHAREPGHFYYGFPFNSGSHYDEEFGEKKGKRIVSIADAFATGVVPHYHHFTTVAERTLGVEVANLGMAGLGPYEYLHLVKTQANALDPDVVIVNVFVGDDLYEAWLRQRERLGRKRTLLESWYTRSSVYLYLVPQRLFAFAAEASRTPDARRNQRLDWEEGAEIRQRPTELARAFPWLIDPQKERDGMSEASFFEIEVQRAAEIATREVKVYTPAFQDAMDRIRGDLEGKPWALVLLPDPFQVDDDLWKRIERELPDRTLNRFYVQEMIKGWAGLHGVPCLDVLPALRAAKPLGDGRRHVFHKSDTQLNARGNEIVGKALGEFLGKQFGFLKN